MSVVECDQLVVSYRGVRGGRVIYATAYEQADANLQKARCEHHHGASRDVKVEKASGVPPSSTVPK